MRPAIRQVPRTIADFQNEKGSATAPTVPSHGSTNPQKDTEMNDVTNTTAAAETPARPVKLQMIDMEDPRTEVRRLAHRISELLDHIDDYERVVICALSVGKWAIHTQFSVDPSEEPDHKILELAKTFEEAYAAEEASRMGCRMTGDWSTWDAAYARTESIVDLIEKETATTLEGLRVKARCIQWCHGDDPVDLALSDTTDARLATQIVQALLHGGIGA